MTAVLGIFDLFYTALLVLWTFWVNFITDFLQDIAALSEWFFSAALLTAAILLLRWLLRDKLSCRVWYALWLVVLARLLLPVQLSLPLPVTGAQLAPAPSAALEEPILVLPDFFPAPQPIPETEIDPDKLTASTEVEAENSPPLNAMSGEDILLFVWKSGACAVLAVLLLSNARFDLWLTRRRKKLELPDVPVPVYLVEGLSSPCLFGLFHPAVYLTPEAAENEGMRRHVLTHELTHYAHRDHIWSVLRCLCLVIHWFDPLVWAAAILSKRDCELACDEGAVSRLGEGERIPYGRTLVDMVAQNSRAHLLSCSTTMTGSKKTIQQRIERLVHHPETKITALFLAVSLVTVAAVFTFAGDEPEPREPGLPTAEEGYAQLTELLENDMPFCYAAPVFSDEPDYPDVISPDIVPNTKQTVLNHVTPLTGPTENRNFHSVIDAAHHLTLYARSDETITSASFCLIPDGEDWYICLRESDVNETDTLIPVARTNGGAVNVLKNAASLQKRVNDEFWMDPAQGYADLTAALARTRGVGLYGVRRGAYAGSSSTSFPVLIEQVISLLSQAAPITAPLPDFEHVPGDRVILYDALAESSPAGWNVREYYLAQRDGNAFLTICHDEVYTPIAALPAGCAEDLLSLIADPHADVIHAAP